MSKIIIPGQPEKSKRDSDGVKIPVATDARGIAAYRHHLRNKGRVSLSLKKGKKEVFIEICVYSVVKIGVKLRTFLSVKAERLEYTVMVAAAAQAEQLCDQYGDRLDPEEVARQAKDAYRELRADPRVAKYFMVSVV